MLNLKIKDICNIDRIAFYIALFSWVYIASFVLDWGNSDATLYLLPWVNHLDREGLLSLLAQDSYNYTAPYAVLLYSARIILPDLLPLETIKFLSVIWLVCTAMVVAYKLKFDSWLKPKWIVILFLYWPTFFVNTCIWGQADIFYASFILISMLNLARGRYTTAVVLFGISISFKLQAILFFPYLIFELLRCKRYKEIIFIPVIVFFVYTLLNSPFLLATNELSSIYATYLTQAETYDSLVLNAPNVWLLFERILGFISLDLSQVWQKKIIFGALLFCSILGLGVAFLGYLVSKKPSTHFRFTIENNILIALSLAVVFPFLLPKMHDRYFFLTDSLALLLLLINKKYLLVSILIVMGSTLAYFKFLGQLTLEPLLNDYYSPLLGAVLMFISAVILLKRLYYILKIDEDVIINKR